MRVKKQVVTESQSRRPRGRPKAEDLVGLEARLVAVGREIFFAQGYGATTMDAVATAARTSKSTLYTRFPSKEALFRAIVHDQVGHWDHGESPKALGLSTTLEATLRRHGELWLRAGTSDDFVNMSRLVFSESARFPELGQSSRTQFNRGLGAIATIIDHFAQRDGVPCKDSHAAAELFQLALGGRVYQSILSNRPMKLSAAKLWLDGAVRLFVGSRTAW